MPEKTRKTGAFDIVREVIWMFLYMLAAYVYFVALLLAVSFVFNSIIDLSLEAILLISSFLTISLTIFRIIKRIIKHG